MNPLKHLVKFINAVYFFRLTVRGRIMPGFSPSKEDLVVDLGSGDKPFWRADITLDNLEMGNEHRFSSSAVNKGIGYFVNGDLMKTPFKDQSFNFSFCNHVLEHIERPDLAIKEIMRISKRGYLEVPNGIMELVYPFAGHLWIIYKIKNELVFIRKSKSMQNVLSEAHRKYFYLAKLIKSPVINFYWKGEIKYKIIDELKESEKFMPSEEDENVQSAYIHKLYLLLMKTLRKVFYKKKEFEFESLLKDSRIT